MRDGQSLMLKTDNCVVIRYIRIFDEQTCSGITGCASVFFMSIIDFEDGLNEHSECEGHRRYRLSYKHNDVFVKVISLTLRR